MLDHSAPSVYLAGQISGLHWEGSIGWRDYVRKELNKSGIASFSPLRAKSYLRPEAVIQGTYEANVLSSQRGIFGRDFNDCISRDLIFVNYLGATERSLGTAMEVAWAYYARKPIVVCIEKSGNPNDHAMLMEAARFRTDNLDEAIWLTKVILLPVDHEGECDG